MYEYVDVYNYQVTGELSSELPVKCLETLPVRCKTLENHYETLNKIVKVQPTMTKITSFLLKPFKDINK